MCLKGKQSVGIKFKKLEISFTLLKVLLMFKASSLWMIRQCSKLPITL